MDDETLIAALVDVKGIGRWTAEMFLIFHELRPDVLPQDDIGLQRAIALHYHPAAAARRGDRGAASPPGTSGGRSTPSPSSTERVRYGFRLRPPMRCRSA